MFTIIRNVSNGDDHKKIDIGPAGFLLCGLLNRACCFGMKDTIHALTNPQGDYVAHPDTMDCTNMSIRRAKTVSTFLPSGMSFKKSAYE